MNLGHMLLAWLFIVIPFATYFFGVDHGITMANSWINQGGQLMQEEIDSLEAQLEELSTQNAALELLIKFKGEEC